MSALLSSVQETALAAKARATQALDNTVTPEKRAQVSSNIRQWANDNPKLAAFIAIHLALSGPPLLLFILFVTSIFISSILTGIAVALVTALAFTAFCTGIALLLLIPTLFLSTISATVVFAWGLVGYIVLHRFSTHPRTAPYADAVRKNAHAASQQAQGYVDAAARKASAMTARTLDSASENQPSSTPKPATPREYFSEFDAAANDDSVDDKQKEESPLVTPGGTLPRNRSYSKNKTAHTRPANPAIVTRNSGLDGDITPLDLVSDHSLPRPAAGGVVPSEILSLRNNIVAAQ